jgi:hypothetical protein
MIRRLFRALRNAYRAFVIVWNYEKLSGQCSVGSGHRRPSARESGATTARGPGRDGLALETPDLRRTPCSPSLDSSGSGGDPATLPQSAGGSTREDEPRDPPRLTTPVDSGPIPTAMVVMVSADGKSCTLIPAHTETELHRIADYQHEMARVTSWGGVG